MKNIFLFKGMVFLSFMLAVIGCNTTSIGDGSVTETANGNKLTVCTFNKVKDTVTMNLSDFVKDFKIVQFENSDKAIFKMGGTPIVTDKHIGIRQSRRPFLLFDHNGKLLCEVGGVGGGPGEYTFLYDEAINDELGKIYLSPFANSSKILEYNTDGSFVRDFIVKGKLNKPKVSVADNGDISIVHMPFDTEDDKFIALQYNKDITLKQELKDVKRFLIQARDKHGNFVGFSNEIFSYRNTSNFDFMMTSCDSLFHYNSKDNKIYPKFTIDFGDMVDVPFHIYTEIPGYYLTYLRRKGVIIVDKKKQTSNYLKVVNDFFCNIEAPRFNFNKGWFYQMFEPSYLKEVIQQRLEESDCSPEDRKQLEDMLASLDENDNSIMFIGKLKN